ncbi:MAG TPA: hypothetical protein VG942_02510 [Hyphomonadaceae bacterium]|nr:hypothetical protein [Hyphomonadaceae bacterium]
MRIALLALGLVCLSGCQTIYDYFAEESCTPGNTPAEERQCQDRVDQNSRDHSR